MVDHSQNSDGTLAYAQRGCRGGKPLFFFHGWPGSRIESALADKAATDFGIHVVAPDRPGFGLSPFQPGRKISDWPATIAELAGELGWNRFSIFAVSGGTPYALVCAKELADRIDSVGVCSGVPAHDWHEAEDTPLLSPARLARFRHSRPHIMKAMVRLLRSYLSRSTGDSFLTAAALLMPESDRQIFRTSEVKGMFAASVREALRGPLEGSNHDLGLLTSPWPVSATDLQSPIRYWHGDQDSICPITGMKSVLEKATQHSLEVLDGEGHFSLPVNRIKEILAYFAS